MCTLKILADTTPLNDAIDLLESVVDFSFKGLDFRDAVALIKSDCSSARGANELRISFYPTNSFHGFVSALRAG